MEKSASNNFRITKQLYMEAMLQISREGYVKAAGKVICLILGLWCVLAVYMLATEKNPEQLVGPLIVIAAVALWVLVGMPRYYARRAWRSLQAKYGTDMERSIDFYEDHMEVHSESVEMKIPYENISKVMHSKRLLILICNDKTGILVARDGFSAGSENTVRDLIGK